MCTAVVYKTKDLYFGRTLDNDFSYNEEVTITPRNYPFTFKNVNTINQHYAIIGMAHITDGYPLYYDGVNEKGLCMAGLNFIGNAVYNKIESQKQNIAQFEFIPWILAQCKNVEEAYNLLMRINIISQDFNEELKTAQLHWIIADKEKTLTIECVDEGMKICDNPVGVLTNNPPFDKQLFSLNNYMSLSAQEPVNSFSDNLNLKTYSRGMGAIGLPGDLSSQSRFIRASFIKMNSVSDDSNEESVNQFYHIMNSVEQPKGCCVLNNKKYETTIYTSCCNADRGIYYYTPYGNHQITAINMKKENLNGKSIIHYPLTKVEQIKTQN